MPPDRPPYVLVVAELNAGAIRRTYEFPHDPDDVDRQAFLRWLFDVMPAQQERYQGGQVSFFQHRFDG